MSVIVNMACGLANRMFQYAFYLRLQKEGYDVYVDYFTTPGLAHETVDWFRIFPKAVFRQAAASDIKKWVVDMGYFLKSVESFSL